MVKARNFKFCAWDGHEKYEPSDDQPLSKWALPRSHDGDDDMTMMMI